MRDIKKNPFVPFGVIPILFSGDFRQILPVVRGGGRHELIAASLQNSYLWPHIKHIQLKENMRITMRSSDNPENAKELEAFNDSFSKSEMVLPQLTPSEVTM